MIAKRARYALRRLAAGRTRAIDIRVARVLADRGHVEIAGPAGAGRGAAAVECRITEQGRRAAEYLAAAAAKAGGK